MSKKCQRDIISMTSAFVAVDSPGGVKKSLLKFAFLNNRDRYVDAYNNLILLQRYVTNMNFEIKNMQNKYFCKCMDLASQAPGRQRPE